MRNAALLVCGSLRSADIETAVDLGRVANKNFAAELFSERDAQG
jgi:hypothetical protein